MSEHAQICDLIANLINEQRNTTEAVVKLTEAIAKAGTASATKAKATAAKAIETAQTAAAYTEQKAVAAEPAAPAPMVETVGESTAQSQDAAGPTLDKAKELILKLAAEKGREVALDVLKPFDVTRVGHLAPEQVAPFVKAAEEALA